MAITIELKLPSGKSVYAETADVSGQFNQLAATKSGGRSLTDVVTDMRETLTVIAGALDDLTPRAPDKVAVELSFELGTNGVLKLLGADAKGGIKVALTWDAKPKP